MRRRKKNNFAGNSKVNVSIGLLIMGSIWIIEIIFNSNNWGIICNYQVSSTFYVILVTTFEIPCFDTQVVIYNIKCSKVLQWSKIKKKNIHIASSSCQVDVNRLNCNAKDLSLLQTISLLLHFLTWYNTLELLVLTKVNIISHWFVCSYFFFLFFFCYVFPLCVWHFHLCKTVQLFSKFLLFLFYSLHS